MADLSSMEPSAQSDLPDHSELPLGLCVVLGVAFAVGVGIGAASCIGRNFVSATACSREQGEGSAETPPSVNRPPVPESWGNPDLWEERSVMSGQFTKLKESGGIYDTVPIEGRGYRGSSVFMARCS